MRIFKTKSFNRDAKKHGLTDEVLEASIKEVEEGLVDADLGGGVVKKRVAKPGKGKSSGSRTIIAFRRAKRAFFIYCYDHGEQDNITTNQLKVLKLLAKDYQSKSDKKIQQLLDEELLFEIERGENNGE